MKNKIKKNKNKSILFFKSLFEGLFLKFTVFRFLFFQAIIPEISQVINQPPAYQIIDIIKTNLKNRKR